jgi:serine/threonine-protein kinase
MLQRVGVTSWPKSEICDVSHRARLPLEPLGEQSEPRPGVDRRSQSSNFRDKEGSVDRIRAISTKDIQAELNRIFMSEPFTNAGRMKRFLEYVVEQSFHGKDDNLSEYWIGLRVYDRDDGFDPRLDSIVRVDAARLRAKLREFYDSEGRSSAFRIDIPKGSYKATFKTNKATLNTRRGPRPISERSTAKETSDAKTIAVLPFTDLSPERDQEYFGDGIAEELMFALSRVPKLRVVSQTSVFAFKGKGMDVRDIGGQLGVGNILEGSVRKAGQKLRITVRLTDVISGFHVWSEVFTCELKDIFVVQEEIARSVADALRLTVVGGEPVKLPAARACNVNAFNQYLIGRAFWNKQTEHGLRTAITHFEHSLEEDPSYAKAYFGISDCYRKLEFWGLMRPLDALPRAKEAAQKALEMDGSLMEARVPLAAITAVNEWHWDQADSMFQNILSFHPDYAPAHQAYAMMCLLPMRRFEEAIDHVQIARQLDPLALLINVHVGGAFYLAGRYDEAIEQLRNTLELEPNYHLAHLGLAVALGEKGMLNEAMAVLDRAKTLAGEIMPIRGALGNMYARAGEVSQAEATLAELVELQKVRYVSPLDFALIHAGLGRAADVFQCLKRAATDHCGRLAWTLIEPRYEGFRSDPRFAELLQHVNLAPPTTAGPA